MTFRNREAIQLLLSEDYKFNWGDILIRLTVPAENFAFLKMSWLFLVILSALSQTSIYAHESECSSNFSSHIGLDKQPFQYNSNWYFTLKKRVHLFEARKMCEKAHGQLIMFRSVDEMLNVVPNLECRNVTECPLPEVISYWTNVYDNKYIRQDFRFIDIPSELSNKYFSYQSRHQSIIYSRDTLFFAYDSSYRAKPFCKVDCLQRKSANNLTDSEIKELQNAMLDFSMDHSSSNLRNLLMTYKVNINRDQFIYGHNSNVFFHWGRLFLLYFELLLQRKLNIPIGVPYWDWLCQELPELVKNESFIDRMGRSRSNLFRGVPVNTYPPQKTKFPYRNPKLEEILRASKCSIWSDLRLALSMSDFCNFIQQYSTIISRILIAVGGSEMFSMSNEQYAINDPLYILIMANSDRHFALWRRMRHEKGENASIKACKKPDVTNENLNPFHTRLITNQILRENAHPKSVDSHAYLFYRYDTQDICTHGKKLDEECPLTQSKSHLWIKIEFSEDILCSAVFTIIVTLPPKSSHRTHQVIYRDKVYVHNCMTLCRTGKSKVYKDVSGLQIKYPFIRNQCILHLSYKCSKNCPKKKTPKHKLCFVEGENE